MIIELCGAFFSDASNLRRHFKGCHDNETKNFSCETCQACFKRSDHLSRHLLAAHGARKPVDNVVTDFICEVCDKGFTLKKNLKRHMRQAHEEMSDDRPCLEYSCSLGKNSYGIKKNLIRHMRDKHIDVTGEADMDDGQMFCPECDFISLTYEALTQHLIELHGYQSNVLNEKFRSLDEFYAWKKCAEKCYVLPDEN